MDCCLPPDRSTRCSDNRDPRCVSSPACPSRDRLRQSPSSGQWIGQMQKLLESADAPSIFVGYVDQIGLHIVEASPVRERSWRLEMPALDRDAKHVRSRQRSHIVEEQANRRIDLLQLDRGKADRGYDHDNCEEGYTVISSICVLPFEDS